MDNASTIGSGEPLVAQGGGRAGLSGVTNVAQNAFDLAAERGLSSFDQRHLFTADYLWELPFGHDRRWLTGNSPLRAIFGDWNWSGDWTIASGLPFTPRVLGDPSDVSRGTNGTIRADLVPGQPVERARSVGRAVVQYRRIRSPTGAFGDARRNSIEGPGSGCSTWHSPRFFRSAKSRSLEFRAQFSNIFNTPQYLHDRHNRELADVRPGDFRGGNAVAATDGALPLLGVSFSRTLRCMVFAVKGF